MSVRALNDLFQFAHVLKTSVDKATKKILAQIGSVVGQGQPDVDNVEWWQHVGFASRPSDPEPGKDAAQAFVVRQGGIDAAIASQDLRGLDIYGNLKPGETCVYACGADGTAQARTLYKADGSITHYTRKGNTASGTGMMMALDAANGAIRLVNDKGYGLVIDADGVKLFTSGAALTLTDSDAKLVATGKCQVDGSTVALGSMPLPGVGAVLKGLTGIAGVASLKVVCE